MGVDPDKDQTVDDKPTTLLDDFEVDVNKPNDGDNVGDDNIEVKPDEDQTVEDKPTTLPDDNGNIDTNNPNNSWDNVDDNMEVNP